MTDDDRQLLLELRRMTDACGAFCAGVIEGDLSREDQLALSSWLADMAERVRHRAMRTPVIIEGEAVSPACQPRGATAEEQRTLGERLIAVGERLRRRADEVNRTVVEGEVLADTSLVLPANTVEPD